MHIRPEGIRHPRKSTPHGTAQTELPVQTRACKLAPRSGRCMWCISRDHGDCNKFHLDAKIPGGCQHCTGFIQECLYFSEAERRKKQPKSGKTPPQGPSGQSVNKGKGPTLPSASGTYEQQSRMQAESQYGKQNYQGPYHHGNAAVTPEMANKLSATGANNKANGCRDPQGKRKITSCVYPDIT
jgi:hypothetical protein